MVGPVPELIIHRAYHYISSLQTFAGIMLLVHDVEIHTKTSDLLIKFQSSNLWSR